MKKVSFKFRRRSRDATAVKSENDVHPEKKVALKRFLAQIVACCLINLAFIEHSMVMGFPTIVIPELMNSTTHLNFTEEEASWFGSLPEILPMFGSACLWILFDKIGSRFVLIIALIPHVISWYMYYFSQTTSVLFVAEVLSGLVIGVISASVATYISEISSPEMRGKLISFSVISEKLGYFIIFFLGALSDWKTVACLSGLLPIATAILLIQIPDSPMWLVSKGRLSDAERSLCWLRGWVSPEQVRFELTELTRNADQEVINSIFESETDPDTPIPTICVDTNDVRRKSLYVKQDASGDIREHIHCNEGGIKEGFIFPSVSRESSMRTDIRRTAILRDAPVRNKIRRASVARDNVTRDETIRPMVSRNHSVRDDILHPRRQSLLKLDSENRVTSIPMVNIIREDVLQPKIFRNESIKNIRRGAVVRGDSLRLDNRHECLLTRRAELRRASVADNFLRCEATHPNVFRKQSVKRAGPTLVSRENSVREQIRRAIVSRENSIKEELREGVESRDIPVNRDIRRKSLAIVDRSSKTGSRRASVGGTLLRKEAVHPNVFQKQSVKRVMPILISREDSIREELRRAVVRRENSIKEELGDEESLREVPTKREIRRKSVAVLDHSITNEVIPEHESVGPSTSGIRRESAESEGSLSYSSDSSSNNEDSRDSRRSSEETRVCRSSISTNNSHNTTADANDDTLVKFPLQLLKDLGRKESWRPLLLVLVYTTANTFSGFHSTRPYLIHVFEKLKVPMHLKWTVVLYGAIGLLGVAISLALVRWTGKRRMSLGCVATITVCCFTIGTYSYLYDAYEDFGERLGTWFPLFMFLLLHLAQCGGPKILTWLLVNEIFPQSTRTVCIIIINCFTYIIGFIGMKFYLEMEDRLNFCGVFWLYGTINALGFIYLFVELHDPKAKLPEAVQNHLNEPGTSKSNVYLQQISSSSC